MAMAVHRSAFSSHATSVLVEHQLLLMCALNCVVLAKMMEANNATMEI